MKRVLAILIVALLFAAMLCGCTSLKPTPVDVDNGYKSYDSNDGYGQDDVKDWMKDNAQGKDYDYDDGGSYYCMGKGDTCSRKTKNAYDLYCSSCDPDGDNIEG